MFGDFSRFENDPEIGLNGIYLSQGSPILDSDWNEQMAALTDWITVVGKFVDNKREGLGVTVNDATIRVGRGLAVCEGRIIHNASVQEATIANKKIENARHIYSDGDVKNSSSQYFCVVSRNLPGLPKASDDGVPRSRHSVEVTTWAVVLSDDQNYPEFRTTGGGRHLVPPMKVENIQCFSSETTTGLIECHWVSPDRNAAYLKVADTPHSGVSLTKERFPSLAKEAPLPPIAKDTVIEVPIGECVLLDMLDAGTTTIYGEFEDDRRAVLQGAWTLHPKGDQLRLYAASPILQIEVTRTPNAHQLKVIGEYKIQGLPDTLALGNDKENTLVPERNPCLRLWNRVMSCTMKDDKVDSIKDHVGKPVVGISIEEKYQSEDAYLIAGDRWYVDQPRFSNSSIKGHRVFRTLIKENKLTQVPSIASSTDQRDMQFAHETVVPEPAERLPRFASTQPVAHRLDDSLHRLTGALNAARALTRHTPCKELSTRVSYLPLRRWLASTYVHEIVDHDLEAFLAKVRRSVDVAPEDEHRFREQSALILEEANALAGRIPSGEEPRRPQDIV